MEIKKNIFYILEKISSNNEIYNQEAEITESQKLRRQKWIEQLKGIRPLEDDEETKNENSVDQSPMEFDNQQVQKSMEIKKENNMQNVQENNDMQYSPEDIEEYERLEKELSDLLKDYGMELNIPSGENEYTDEKQIPYSVIRMLVDKFLKQKILLSNEDLNNIQKSLEQTYGNIQWNISDLVKHKVTKEFNKMPYDKYGYKDENGKRSNYTIGSIY